MSIEKSLYPSLDPTIQQEFAAIHKAALQSVVAMHTQAGTVPLTTEQWSTPVYDSFSNNDVFAQTPLHNQPKFADARVSELTIDANGRYEPVFTNGTKTVGGEEFSQVFSIKAVRRGEIDRSLLVRTRDLQANRQAQQSELASKQAQRAENIGVTTLQMTVQTAQSFEVSEPYIGSAIENAQRRPLVVRGVQPTQALSKSRGHSMPRRWPEFKG